MGMIKAMFTRNVSVVLKAHIECSDCGQEEILDAVSVDFHCNDEYRCERCTSRNKPLLQGIYEHLDDNECVTKGA